MKQQASYIDKKQLHGIDVLCEQSSMFRNARIGLVTNNAARTSGDILSRAALLAAGFNIVKLFSPEHGLAAKGEDGALQPNITDPFTQLPVTSLYGDHLKPTEEDMAGIDMMLFDILDVGCRFYTYLWTMTYVMEACAMYNKPLIIADRPNPISGNMKMAEGPMLDENCSSFIGRWNIPIRHSCTLGELANYFSADRKMDIDLNVIKLVNWKRDQLSSQKNFIPISPAMSNMAAALCYPGTGLLEGINVNEGRGTDHAFTLFGAPWIDPALLLQRLGQQNLPGIRFSPIQYTPSAGLYAAEKSFGLTLSVFDEKIFLPVQTGIAIMRELVSLFPGQCRERLYKTVANPGGERHLDKLSGIANCFSKLAQGVEISTRLNGQWQETAGNFLFYN